MLAPSIIAAAAEIAEQGIVLQRQEAVGEALGYVEQLAVFRRQVKALPFTKGLRALPRSTATS